MAQKRTAMAQIGADRRKRKCAMYVNVYNNLF
jgi:hypothetical protein